MVDSGQELEVESGSLLIRASWHIYLLMLWNLGDGIWRFVLSCCDMVLHVCHQKMKLVRFGNAHIASMLYSCLLS